MNSPRVADVAEHRSRFHRSELVPVAEEDEPGAVVEGSDQLRHEGERDHRGLVDHDQVEGERVVPVVAESGGTADKTQEPVQRRDIIRNAVADGFAAVQASPRIPDRLLEPGCRLAGRRGQGDSARFAV